MPRKRPMTLAAERRQRRRLMLNTNPEEIMKRSERHYQVRAKHRSLETEEQHRIRLDKQRERQRDLRLKEKQAASNWHRCECKTEKSKRYYEEKLIRLVQEREALWNVSDMRYRSRVVSRRLWREIAQEMEEPCNNLKIKWRYLRSKFRREFIKGHQQAVVDGVSDGVEWRYARLMRFLNDTFTSYLLLPTSSILEMDTEETSISLPICDMRRKRSSPSTDPSSTTSSLLSVPPTLNITPSPRTYKGPQSSSRTTTASASSEKQIRNSDTTKQEAMQNLMRLKDKQMEENKKICAKKYKTHWLTSSNIKSDTAKTFVVENKKVLFSICVISIPPSASSSPTVPPLQFPILPSLPGPQTTLQQHLLAMKNIKEKKMPVKMSGRKDETEGVDFNFFMSLLPYMKTLPDIIKLKIRNQIQNDVLEALNEAEALQGEKVNL